MSKARGSPRKFSEKIALLNKKEAEGTAEFEKILKEVEETTRAPSQPPLVSHYNHQLQQPSQQQQQSKQYYGLPQRSSSFSNWQRCAPQVHASMLQQPLLNHGQYLTQPVQYNANQIHQQHSQTRHASLYVNQQVRHQHQQVQQSPFMSPPQQHQHQAQPFQQQQHHAPNVQQRQQQPSNHMDINNDAILHPSLGVPNIEIFPIDDDQSYQQMTSAPSAATLTDGHYRHDCSNSSISSARSLPNIANLSVSQTADCFSPQASSDQHLMHAVRATTTATTTTNDNQLSPEPIVTSSHQNDAYATTDYYDTTEEYCSLPAIQEPVQSINRDALSRQSQSSVTGNGSWQDVVTSSAPCSAAPTPPSTVRQASNDYDGNQQRSPNSTSRQQSPQLLLHQDYYPSQQLQSSGQMMRASSTNIINKYPTNGHLEAPCINNNLSKSSDAYYGYLDEYVGNNVDYSDNGQTGDNFGNTSLNIVNQSTNSLVRGRSGNDIDNININNDCKVPNQCIETLNQQQFIDTSHYPFYG